MVDRSIKHPSDIYIVLSFVLSGLADLEFDADFATRRAASIGEDALQLWNAILGRVRSELDELGPLF